MGRYDNYMNDPNSIVGAYGQKREEEQGTAFPAQGNAPAPPGPASQGALQGEAPAGAEPAFNEAGAAIDPATGQQMGPTNERAEQGRQFFDYFQEADDDEKDELTNNVLEPIEASGLSGEGAVAQAFARDPQNAANVAAKYGITPPPEPGGTPGFRTEEGALNEIYGPPEATEDETAEARKKQRRQAIGGFLFEMGLRILASNRPDAGGAIAEGALGTIEARRQRQIDAEDREYELSEREYTEGEREEAATDRTRRREREDTAAETAASAEQRAKNEEARRQELHDAKLEAGGSAVGARQPTAFEVQWGFYREAYGDEDMATEDEQELRQQFLRYYNREDRMSTREREQMITQYIKYNDDSPDDAWFDMTGEEKRAAAIEAMGLDVDDADGDDPLGLR